MVVGVGVILVVADIEMYRVVVEVSGGGSRSSSKS